MQKILQILIRKILFILNFILKTNLILSQMQKLKKLIILKKKTFSKVIVSQTSSLSFDFLSLKRNFSVIDFDYKQNYISTYLNKNKNINFLKN